MWCVVFSVRFMDAPRTTSPGLRELIDQQGRKAVWIAARLAPPVDPSTITRWASGERVIPDERVSQLAELLGVSEDEIRGRRAA